MTNHLAAVHNVNPCIDIRGNRARASSEPRTNNIVQDVDAIDGIYLFIFYIIIFKLIMILKVLLQRP